MQEKPQWLRIKAPDNRQMQAMKAMFDHLAVHTVCESAQCPNAGECFGNLTATFMILGNICSRNCRFCAVDGGTCLPPDVCEPVRIAEAAERLQLQHVVITAVTRDDLADGGAAHFAAVIKAVRERLPQSSIEVLISDLAGNDEALAVVVAARPDVLAHNIETVPRLYDMVRPQADYQRSIQLLRKVRQLDRTMVTKSGLMLGLGEQQAEVAGTFADLQAAGCTILTLGQYLRPSPAHIEVAAFIMPEAFAWYRRIAMAAGLPVVVAGPLVRSSYHARQAYEKAK